MTSEQAITTTGNTISRNRAVELLGEHGFTPTQSALTMDETQDGYSFDAEVGYAESYEVGAVLVWLGY